MYPHQVQSQNSYVDLFAGAGGWSLAAQRMGLSGIGLEIDEPCILTRKAAGFVTSPGDVRSKMGYHTVEQGLIASPPCQTFSMAGNGSGRREMDKVLEALRVWSWQADFEDPRTGLVLEPLRWIMARMSAGRPFTWIAMEQVPTCLPIWKGYAAILDEIGYHTDVAVLDAVHYGVPQNRKRVVLMAHRERRIHMPIPTMPMGEHISMAQALRTVNAFKMLSNYKNGNTGQRGVRWSNEPSFTVTSHINRNRIVFDDGTEHRLTPAEAGVLQGFPDHFPWQGSLGEQYAQIGNALPPPLAEAILTELVDTP